jgi:hypothetical protein
MRRDFGCWHETDLPRCPQFGRYREESGHGGYERRLPSLTRFRHGRPIFAVTHNTAPHANDVVGYGCRSQAVPLTFAPSVAIRSRRSEAFSLQGS